MPNGPKPESYNIAPSYADQRTVEMLFDELHFNRLLQLAETVCLRHAPNYPEHLPEAAGEGRVIEKLGTRGLRMALELVDGIDEYKANFFCS